MRSRRAEPRASLEAPAMIRRLGAGDESVLAALAREDAHYDLDERSAPAAPLDHDAAAAYLADPQILHWIDERDGVVTGFLLCHVLRLRSNEARELLLYEIGVHRDHRRHGIGRALVDEAIAYMRREGIVTIWVLADNTGAEEFYAACGFAREAPQPMMFIRAIE
jgi:ribosomal protein S18 acetylase RimI-like enzyme